DADIHKAHPLRSRLVIVSRAQVRPRHHAVTLGVMLAHVVERGANLILALVRGAGIELEVIIVGFTSLSEACVLRYRLGTPAGRSFDPKLGGGWSEQIAAGGNCDLGRRLGAGI